MTFSLAVVAAGMLFASPQQESPDPDKIWYDSLEAGRLVGGRIPVDAANPLHALVGSVAPAPEGAAVTLFSNGPSSNRIDLVVVGDGYTSAELGLYANDAAAMVTALFAEPPFNKYANYFNVHRADVVSQDSGVDNDPVQGIQKNTALDMGFWCGGVERLLCVDVGKAASHAATAPDVDHILAVANSPTYGGAGYASSDLATLSARNFSSLEIGLHEFGHSFGDLADEYWTNGSTYTGSEPIERNVSTHAAAAMASLQAKWHQWLGVGQVSTYEGGLYAEFGIFRSTQDSKMRTLGQPYGKVNKEQFVIEIYRQVDPIDSASPPGTYPASATLFVDPLDPIGHTLDVQWSLNGTPISGATGTTLDLAPLGLPSGTHAVSVAVVDNTPLVIDEAERATFLTEVRSWTVEGGPVSYCTAGTSASGCHATISASGTPSATAASGFQLIAADVEGDKTGLFFFGTSGRQASSWGNGTSLQCVATPVSRGGALAPTGTSGQCNGAFSQDLNARWTAKPTQNPGAGATVQAQLWYRDPLNTSNQSTSLSDAIEFGVQP